MSHQAMPTTRDETRITGRTAGAVQCPFHDGALTLDLLLAELDPNETQLFDAALDLRMLASAGDDAAVCLAQLLHVRRLLEGRHYLAFYRVRCWAKRALRIEVREHRNAAWVPCEIALDCARFDEVVNAALARCVRNGAIPPTAHARLVFAT